MGFLKIIYMYIIRGGY